MGGNDDSDQQRAEGLHGGDRVQDTGGCDQLSHRGIRDKRRSRDRDIEIGGGSLRAIHSSRFALAAALVSVLLASCAQGRLYVQVQTQDPKVQAAVTAAVK